jgi:folate-binding protein YgfZ
VPTAPSPEEGARALAERAAIVPRPAVVTWEVTGRDARSWLHRIVTQDVKSLARGRSRLTCVLDAKGRCLALASMRAVERGGADAFGLDLDASAAARAVPHLQRHVIAEDVAFADRSAELAHALLAGPKAPMALDRLGAPVPEEGAWISASLAGVSLEIVRRDLADRPALGLVVPRASLGAVCDAIASLSGVSRADDAAWDVARVEAGLPAPGAEIDERILPNEAGLDRTAVSWTKGCYLGQEPVVMAKHRGHPPTLLSRLTIDAPSVPPAGTALLDASDATRRVGRLTTVVRGVRAPGLLALGFVRFEAAKTGAEFGLEGGGRALLDAVIAGA